MIDWIDGDLLGLAFPAHGKALREGGVYFLTRAFRATGAIAADNSVTRITQLEDCGGGSTGRKLLLSVAFDTAADSLDGAMFVKFSRDFDDDIRDRARYQMEAEVKFGLLSRQQGFPIAVPGCYFADFHRESGTGILITARVPFGMDGVEPQHEKCLDYDIADPLAHYRAIVRALARLAGAHQAGGLGDAVDRYFPFDADALVLRPRTPYTAGQIADRISRYADFAAQYPRLLPENIRRPDFVARLQREAPALQALHPRIVATLAGDPRYIALCHWNANLDNAWFTRSATGLECGLLDWGQVSQMNIAMSLWGSLSGAETTLWDNHLDELLALYAAELRRAGGAELEPARLRTLLALYASLMGLNWLLDTPPYLARLFPALSTFDSRRDQRLRQHEAARTQLQMMTVFMNLWQTTDMARLLREVGDADPAAHTQSD